MKYCSAFVEALYRSLVGCQDAWFRDKRGLTALIYALLHIIYLLFGKIIFNL